MAAFALSQGYAPLKRKINISADDFVIVKHTHEVAGCVCAWARTLLREPPLEFACLE